MKTLSERDVQVSLEYFAETHKVYGSVRITCTVVWESIVWEDTVTVHTDYTQDLFMRCHWLYPAMVRAGMESIVSVFNAQAGSKILRLEA